MIIEAALMRAIDSGVQRLLDELHGAKSLKAAIEADKRLTSRLLDDGTILTGQQPAADDLRVARYTGQTPFTLSSGMQVTLATWEVELLT